jgi:RNA polymerase sigma-70 factor, ECF subfamily
MNNAEQLGVELEAFREKLKRCIGFLVSDFDEAESIVQEAFAIVLSSPSKIAVDAPLYPYVRGIAVNLSKKFIQRRATRATLSDPTATGLQNVAASEDGALTTILKDEMSVRLWLAIGLLPEAYKEAVVLHYIEGIDYPQMAIMLSVKEGTLRARALRGRNLLKPTMKSVVDTWLLSGDE